MPNSTQIPAPRVPIIDQATGLMSREWFRYFNNINTILGGGTGITTVDHGGTGLSTAPSNGQLLIGANGVYALNTLTPSTGITVTNTSGNISVKLSDTTVIAGSYGTVSSVPAYTVNAQGQLTSASSLLISIDASQISSGTLPILRGGTNNSGTPTAGAVSYGDGTSYKFTTVGTAGQVLISSGTSAPTWATPSGGTVTAISITSANGFAGTSSGGATPAITLSTTVTGVLKGNGTAISAAVAATDYVAPSAYASTNGLTMSTARLLGRTTALSGAAEEISVAGGLTLSGGVLTGTSGTVTAVSVTSANGFAGTSSGGATPAITLSTTVTGVLKGNGTAISAATAGTDYTTPTGTENLSNKTITSSSVNSTPIGASSASTGTFTVLNATGNSTLGTSLTDTVTVNGTVQPGVVISGSSSSDALRVTQTGLGNALLVEDAANPDATPFVIDTNGLVISGSTTATSFNGTSTTRLQIQGTTLGPAQMAVGNWGNTTTPPTYVTGKSRSGTIGSHTIVQANDGLGAWVNQGSDGTAFVSATSITSEVDGTPGASSMPGRLIFNTTLSGASTVSERMRITNDGVIQKYQPAPATANAATTLTIANLKTGIISCTGTTYTLTLPTGTNIDGGFSSMTTDMSFEFSVINAASGTVTMAVNTGVTNVGTLTVLTGISARFSLRRTAANTFVLYRLS